MSHMTFRMMMDSGVLRSGDREIRRGPGGIPLYAMNQLPDFVNHSLDVLFGSDQEVSQRMKPEPMMAPRLEPARRLPSDRERPFLSMLRRFGLVDETPRKGSQQPEVPQLLVSRLEEQVRTLELKLKAEQALSRTQREELGKLRRELSRIDRLESELSTERESGKQLVHWLLEAEQELARVHQVFSESSTQQEPPHS